MKRYIAFFLIVSVLACHKDELTTQNPDVIEATGALMDYAPVDGCGLHLSIPKNTGAPDRFAISDRSEALVKPYLIYTNGVLDVKVTVQYQLTGQKKDVLCGFAGKTPFDEVLILSIKPI